MDFVVVGAGALGTILAAHLIENGHRVRVLVRPQRAAQLNADGLRVRGLANISVACDVVTDPAAIESTEVLIVATKTYQTVDAVAPLAHLRAGSVFSVANGVRKNEQLAAVFGDHSVVGCMADVSGELLADGQVEFSRNVCLHLGALNERHRSTVETIAEAINASGVHTRARDDIASVEWSKFVGWLAFMSLSVITRRPTVDFLNNRHHAALAARLIKETATIATARGIALLDQSPMPVKTIAEAPGSAAVDAVCGMGAEFQRIAPQHRMSSLQDLERGARLEFEDTLGYALELARELELGHATLQDCYDLVAGIDAIAREQNRRADT